MGTGEAGERESKEMNEEGQFDTIAFCVYMCCVCVCVCVCIVWSQSKFSVVSTTQWLGARSPVGEVRQVEPPVVLSPCCEVAH